MIRGIGKKSTRTKDLISSLTSNDIAIIYHQDLDEVAARHLAEKKVKAVINGAKSISGKYPNQGPIVLCDSDIPLYDNIGKEAFNSISNNDNIEIINNELWINQSFLCYITPLTRNDVIRETEKAANNITSIMKEFIDNTLSYATKEKDIVLSQSNLSPKKITIKGKHALVVIRGRNYKEDLRAIQSYIEEVKPVMIGVDGGGDAILEFGYIPDIIIGDMDSVSDKCLKSCKEIILHAYRDGRCPAMDRIKKLGLEASIFSFPGTSEDIALILAYENKAELIVTVGSHTNMIDFLEKGRKGMASTLLVRMKVGYKIIDAKGVSELYRGNIKSRYIVAMFAAVLFPITIVARMSPQIHELYTLIAIRIRLLVGL